MKKSIRKLVLRKETVRTLINADLTHAMAGLGADAVQLATESKDKECPLAVAAGR